MGDQRRSLYRTHSWQQSRGTFTVEIGIHALEYVPLSSDERGKNGGLSEYARAIGKGQGAISKFKGATEVYQKLIPHGIGLDVAELQEKTHHLSTIARTEHQDWQWLTELMLSKDWSVRETEAAVSAVKAIDCPEISSVDRSFWLTLTATSRSAFMSFHRAFRGGLFEPQTLGH